MEMIPVDIKIEILQLMARKSNRTFRDYKEDIMKTRFFRNYCFIIVISRSLLSPHLWPLPNQEHQGISRGS
jgi:hypothetical protein